MNNSCLHRTSILFALFGPVLFGQTAPSVRILLPERTRLLQGQQVDLVLEVRNAKAVAGLQVTAGAAEITANFGTRPPPIWTARRQQPGDSREPAVVRHSRNGETDSNGYG